MVLGVLGELYASLGEDELAAATVYTSAVRAHAGGHRATFEGQTRTLAIMLARVGQNDGALLLDAWADLHDVPHSLGHDLEVDTTAVLDRLRDAQSRSNATKTPPVPRRSTGPRSSRSRERASTPSTRQRKRSTIVV